MTYWKKKDFERVGAGALIRIGVGAMWREKVEFTSWIKKRLKKVEWSMRRETYGISFKQKVKWDREGKMKEKSK